MSQPDQNGRYQCPECDSRDTEITFSGRNRKSTECHQCGNEWTEYTGPECPDCGGQNTRKVTHGVLHRKIVIVCRDCDRNKPSYDFSY